MVELVPNVELITKIELVTKVEPVTSAELVSRVELVPRVKLVVREKLVGEGDATEELNEETTDDCTNKLVTSGELDVADCGAATELVDRGRGVAAEEPITEAGYDLEQNEEQGIVTVAGLLLQPW